MAMVEALVLDLGWDPTVVAAMEISEVKYWVDAATRRNKQKQQRGS